MTAGWQLAQAAEDFIGVPFRPGGRDPATGLDCLGLVLAALDRAGFAAPAISSGPWRRLSHSDTLALLPLHGFRPVQGQTTAGDLLIARTGPGQHHVLVHGRGAYAIHAHAGLRRVVRTTEPIGTPIARWRLTADDPQD